jgi:hypothetical protein
MAKTNTDYHKQAAIFSQYIIGESADDSITFLFAKDIQTKKVTLDKKDAAVLQMILRHPWTVGMVDAGLALLRPHSEVRRRIYVMFALLEASPKYWQYFLPVERSGWYIFRIALTGVGSILTSIGGIVLVKVLR